MSLIKLNNRSIKDVTSLPFGVGNLIHISSQTASNSASISFTTGINSTYKEYQFYFIDIHPRTDNAQLSFQGSTNGGSAYATTMTTTTFRAYHDEADTGTALTYVASFDQAQGTGYQLLTGGLGNGADENSCGSLSLFNPSSTTYVKHFISTKHIYEASNFSEINFNAGYFNTTSAINAIDFKMNSGNMDGTIAMFGVL